MTPKLLDRKAALRYLGLTEEQLAVLAETRPLPQPRDVLGVPHWVTGELYQWVQSIPRHRRGNAVMEGTR